MTAILGNLLKQGFKLRQSIEQENVSPFLLQKKQLLRLLFRAKATEFGKVYQFDKIIEAIRKAKKRDKSFYHTYTQQVPIFDYDTIYQNWWSRARENGERNVAWRGGVKYYALSSGTSGAPSKHIPVTRDMIRAIHRTGIRQLLALSNFDIPGKIYSKGILMLGGSTQLNKVDTFFEGDLSGITASQIPFWFQHLFYKPGRRIARNTNWDAKLQEITEQASKWDIGYIAGVPAWIQMLMERIVQHYKLNNIHDIWPNLTAYAYGGVSIEPYRKGFEKVLGRPIHFIETYLASEGFIAYQMYPGQNLRLVLNNGIFHEFIPFNTENFGPDGELIGNPKTLMIDEIEEGKNYALLISTCAGAWRYLIGDTIMFTNKHNSEIIITGRTKHFLSLCGEHLSVDNMNKAIDLVSEKLNVAVKEFTVVGVPYDTLFAHYWYVGVDQPVDEQALKDTLDESLKNLNDDYRVERSAALKEVIVKAIPNHLFYKWMEQKGKIGGQNKFPRVLKANQHEEWQRFLQQEGIILT